MSVLYKVRVRYLVERDVYVLAENAAHAKRAARDTEDWFDADEIDADRDDLGVKVISVEPTEVKGA